MGPPVVSVLEKLEVVLPSQYNTLFVTDDDTNLLLHMITIIQLTLSMIKIRELIKQHHSVPLWICSFSFQKCKGEEL
jgi:hypothetical protein